MKIGPIEIDNKMISYFASLAFMALLGWLKTQGVEIKVDNATAATQVNAAKIDDGRVRALDNVDAGNTFKYLALVEERGEKIDVKAGMKFLEDHYHDTETSYASPGRGHVQ